MSELLLSRVRSGSDSACAARPWVSAIVWRGSIAVFAPLSTARGDGIYALDSILGVWDSKINDDKANGSEQGEGGGSYSFNSLLAHP